MPVDVGDPAPDFTLRDQHGQPVRLSDYRGRRSAVVVFYPLAFSSVCTGELCTLRDELADFDNDEAQLLTVSVDSTFTHAAWAEQQGYTFPLLSDFWPHGEVALAYGCFDEQLGVATRGTFLVDAHGVVAWKVVNGVPDARSTGDYRDALGALQAA